MFRTLPCSSSVTVSGVSLYKRASRHHKIYYFIWKNLTIFASVFTEKVKLVSFLDAFRKFAKRDY